MKRIVRIGQTTITLVGVLGTLTCMGAMVLAVIGVAGVGASAAIAGMSMGTQVTSGLHPGRIHHSADLHWYIRPVARYKAMGGCHPRTAGGWCHLLGDVRPAAPARDVRYDGAWPAQLGCRFPLGVWLSSQACFLSLRRVDAEGKPKGDGLWQLLRC